MNSRGFVLLFSLFVMGLMVLAATFLVVVAVEAGHAQRQKEGAIKATFLALSGLRYFPALAKDMADSAIPEQAGSDLLYEMLDSFTPLSVTGQETMYLGRNGYLVVSIGIVQNRYRRIYTGIWDEDEAIVYNIQRL